MSTNGTNHAATGPRSCFHTYTEDGGINYLAAAAMLPSRSVIDERLRRADEPDVPGFRGRTAGGFERSAASDQKPIAEFALAIEAGVLQKPRQISSGRHREKRADELLAGFFLSCRTLREDALDRH